MLFWAEKSTYFDVFLVEFAVIACKKMFYCEFNLFSYFLRLLFIGLKLLFYGLFEQKYGCS